MHRERWFYAKDMRRTGPLPKRQLVESLLALPDPRACLIWRHGLPAWTPAREVAEIDRQLAPFVKPQPEPAVEPAWARAGSFEAGGTETTAEQTTRIPGPTGARLAREGKRSQQPNIVFYFGGLAALLAMVVVAWLLWPRTNSREDPPPPRGTQEAKPRARPPVSQPGGALSTDKEPRAGPPVSQPGGALSTDKESSAETPTFTGWSDQEADVPPAELRRLRGVGAWSGERLTITLYNGSTWRITEILVRTSRLTGDEFVDADTPHRLLPVGAAPLDAGTAELLKKVAPDRRKAGVSPLDTGPFEASVGPQPPAYRWRIEGARGYPPRP